MNDQNVNSNVVEPATIAPALVCVDSVMVACHNGNAAIVKAALDAGMSANALDKDGFDFLGAAICQNATDIVQLLIERGANVHYVDLESNTSLELAAQFAGPQIMQMLIDQGVDIHARDNLGNTALHLAACNHNTELIDFLVQKGVDPLAFNAKGITCLQQAADWGMSMGVPDFCKIDGLLQAKGLQGQTALQMSTYIPRLRVMQALVDGGADVNELAQNGMTAFEYAQRRGNVPACLFLVAHGAKIGLNPAAQPKSVTENSSEEDKAIAAASLSPIEAAAALGNTRLIINHLDGVVDDGQLSKTLAKRLTQHSSIRAIAGGRGLDQVISWAQSCDLAVQAKQVTQDHVSVRQARPAAH